MRSDPSRNNEGSGARSVSCASSPDQEQRCFDIWVQRAEGGLIRILAEILDRVISLEIAGSPSGSTPSSFLKHCPRLYFFGDQDGRGQFVYFDRPLESKSSPTRAHWENWTTRPQNSSLNYSSERKLSHLCSFNGNSESFELRKRGRNRIELTSFGARLAIVPEDKPRVLLRVLCPSPKKS